MGRVTANPHKAAALAYGGLGVLVIFITFIAGLVPRTQEDAFWQLVIGAVFVLSFAVLIWRGWWLLAAFLVLSNAWRAITFLNQGLGLHVEPWALSVTPVEPRPIAFVNAAVMAMIVFMLVRSARIGFSDWRTRG